MILVKALGLKKEMVLKDVVLVEAQEEQELPKVFSPLNVPALLVVDKVKLLLILALHVMGKVEGEKTEKLKSVFQQE